ncbi:hypothetical protein GCM10009655_04790 [Rhodoglobus aureus]|uniref:Uncharacterized protein n=1 Tax=Rhodoglobus aureus TaxID=191497 RepID=A0ABP4G3B2_9MICO
MPYPTRMLGLVLSNKLRQIIHRMLLKVNALGVHQSCCHLGANAGEDYEHITSLP